MSRKPGCVSSKGLNVQVTARLTHRPWCKSVNWRHVCPCSENAKKNVLFLEKLITLLLLLTLLASTPQTQGESMFQRRKSFLWIKTLSRNNSWRGDVLKRSNICCDGFAWLQKFWGYHSPSKFFMCLREKNLLGETLSPLKDFSLRHVRFAFHVSPP